MTEIVLTYRDQRFFAECNPGGYKRLGEVVGVLSSDAKAAEDRGMKTTYPILERALQEMNAIAGVELARIAVVNGLNLYSVVPLVLG